MRFNGYEHNRTEKRQFFAFSCSIKKLYFNDRDKFNDIKRKYLPRKWFNDNFDIIVREIAHNIRTTYNRKQKQFNPYQKELF